MNQLPRVSDPNPIKSVSRCQIFRTLFAPNSQVCVGRLHDDSGKLCAVLCLCSSPFETLDQTNRSFSHLRAIITWKRDKAEVVTHEEERDTIVLPTWTHPYTAGKAPQLMQYCGFLRSEHRKFERRPIQGQVWRSGDQNPTADYEGRRRMF